MPTGVYIRTKPIWNKGTGIKVKRICKNCNKTFETSLTRLKFSPANYCSRKCMGLAQGGVKNHNWINGIVKEKRGYVLVYTPKHPSLKNKRPYVFEHRLVMEKYLGRYLESWEVIHHINGIRNDNRIENLQLCSHLHFGQVGKKMWKEIRRLRCLLKRHNIVY